VTPPTHGSPAPGASRLLRVSAEPANLAQIRRFVAAEAVELGADQGSVWDLVQAVDESVTNIIVHGYRGNRGIVEVEVRVDAGALVVHLRDHAPPFDPTRVPRPDLGLPLERRPLGGMGVHLTRELTDEARYGIPEGWGNELTLIKRIESARHAGG
jgi:anti-sigma regulatory factor (Ser/Thr protein kinase)